MVELDVLVIGAAGEDSAMVVLEVAGSHRYGEWTNLKMKTTLSLNIKILSKTDIGKVSHDGILVIGRQVVVAGDGGDRADRGQVVLAILVVGCCPGNVRVVGLRHLARIIRPTMGARPGRRAGCSCSRGEAWNPCSRRCLRS